MADFPAKSPNFRTDYDKVLFAFVEEHVLRAEEKLFDAQQDVYMYQAQEPKDPLLKEKIISEIDRELVILEETLAETVTQSKRTDFSDFETYIVARLNGDVSLLIKHFTHLKSTVH